MDGARAAAKLGLPAARAGGDRVVAAEGLWPDAPYAYSAAARGDLVFTAGACPLDNNGAVVAPGDYAAQAERAVDNLRLALQAQGADLDGVVKTTIYVVARGRSDLVTVWRVVAAAFGEAVPPSTLLGVAVLGYPGQLVEVEAVAVPRAVS